MEWKPIHNRNDMPKDELAFLAIWKGRICIVRYNQDENNFWICFDPTDYVCVISPERENKFTHYMLLPEEP